MIVIRVSRTGKLGESRPCFHCLEKLEKSDVNIQNVYYSTKEGVIEKEKLKSMKDSEKTIYCSGYLNFRKKIKKPVNKFVYNN